MALADDVQLLRERIAVLEERLRHQDTTLEGFTLTAREVWENSGAIDALQKEIGGMRAELRTAEDRLREAEREFAEKVEEVAQTFGEQVKAAVASCGELVKRLDATTSAAIVSRSTIVVGLLGASATIVAVLLSK